MLLHIGDGRVVRHEDILVILPIAKAGGDKASILLANGGEVRSPISSGTLRKRLDGREMLRELTTAEE